MSYPRAANAFSGPLPYSSVYAFDECGDGLVVAVERHVGGEVHLVGGITGDLGHQRGVEAVTGQDRLRQSRRTDLLGDDPASFGMADTKSTSGCSGSAWSREIWAEKSVSPDW